MRLLLLTILLLTAACTMTIRLDPGAVVIEPVASEDPTPTREVLSSPTPSIRLQVNAGISANIRSGPSTATGVVAIVPGGTILSQIGSQGDWHQVQLADGRTGWIFSTLVRRL